MNQSSLKINNAFKKYFYFLATTRSMWDPQEPQPLQRKLGVLTTGLPGN